ncbi:HNH endonuclease [Stutzerimonas stutzeri]|uniref:HNH endonuclease n=1 Tax=Stutzerimonas stutzeri TaxID=316 RepID=UPI00244C82F5|nr:HNH endonuclease [Stutzerimonas stutzeri]MDH0157304.1 HNH endonuclease [Stutzerimonas stutzeri]
MTKSHDHQRGNRPRHRMDVASRFWSKVNKQTTSGCWEWTKSLRTGGYGAFRVDGKTSMQYAHRVAWMLVNGEIPDGLYVCHSCDNRKCCNPSHLWLGTAKENQMDMAAKGRTHSHQKKLTEQDVLEVRRRYASGETTTQIAGCFGVTRSAIYRIATGRSRRVAP